MTASQIYKANCREIYRKYRRPLNLLYIDACEIADLIGNQMSKAEVFGLLDESAKDNAN